jgi:hypothetical protein
LAALASGYPLHHLRPHRFAVSGFGGSASIPLATNVFFLFFHYYNLSLYIMAQDLVLNAGILTLVTEGHLYGDDANDSRIPHFPQNTFYVASAAQFNNLPADAKRYNRGKNFAKGNIVGLKAGGEFVLVDNAPPRHALSPSSYPMNKKVSFGGLQVDATLVTSGGNSGITIGVGSDLGAGGWAVSRIQDVFGNKLLVPEKMVTALTNAAGKIGIPAAHALAQYNMRNVVRLTQQQVCDLLTLQWNSPDSYYLSAAKKGFPQSWNAMHPILHEIVMKIAYGYGNVTAGHADNIRALDASLKSQSELQQLTAFKAALLKDNASSADKFAKFIDVAIDTIQKGGKVTITKDPIKMDELTKASNPTLDIVAKVTGNSKLRSRIETARAQEPEKMKEAMAKLGQTYVPPQTNPVTPNPTPNTDTTNTDTNDSDSTSIVELIKMAMAGKGSIKGKVGVGGDNNTQDVIVIKALLNSHGYYDFTYNPVTLLTEMFTIGKSDAKLEAAITKFQTDKGAKKPDGRVDPNGTTLGWLNGPKATATVETPPVVDTPVVTPPNNNSNTNPPTNGKQLVIHEAVLALGTEGVPCGENSLDVRLPHWPGYASGVSIGVGFDIGASKITATELQNVMGILGVPKAMVDELAKTVNVQAEPARDLLASLKLREKVRITQQQAIDIMVIMKQKIGASTRRAFSTSFATTHPAVIEVLHKFAYGAPALVLGYPNGGFKGLGPMYDAKLAAISDPKAQCDLCVEMCDAVTAHFGPTSVHGKIGNGLKNFIKYIKTQLEAGVEVVIDKKPITMEALLDPSNKTLDLAALVSAKTYGGEVAAHNKRNALQKARTEEPARIKAVCDKIGSTVPKLSGSALEGENMEACYKLLTKKDLAVEKVQEQLVRLGYYKKAGISGDMKNVDGGLGPNTKKVIALFQTEYNQKATQKLPTNGELDNATKTAILGNQTQGQNTTPVNPVEPPKVTMPALMGDATYGCYH